MFSRFLKPLKEHLGFISREVVNIKILYIFFPSCDIASF
jgi:hypothetical protein